jgi:hypothetical protein
MPFPLREQSREHRSSVSSSAKSLAFGRERGDDLATIRDRLKKLVSDDERTSFLENCENHLKGNKITVFQYEVRWSGSVTTWRP